MKFEMLIPETLITHKIKPFPRCVCPQVLQPQIYAGFYWNQGTPIGPRRTFWCSIWARALKLRIHILETLFYALNLWNYTKFTACPSRVLKLNPELSNLCVPGERILSDLNECLHKTDLNRVAWLESMKNNWWINALLAGVFSLCVNKLSALR